MQAFSYTASVKLINDRIAAFDDEYPGVTDFNAASRTFDDYNTCMVSCKTLMDDMKGRINLKSPKIVYKVGSEVNPVYSKQETISKDWEPGEVARLWIYDEKMEKSGQIHAIGQARIYTAESSGRPLLS